MTAFFLSSSHPRHFHALSLSLQSSPPCTAVVLPPCSGSVSGKLGWPVPPGYCSRCKAARPGERRTAGRPRSAERYSGESGADWWAGFIIGSVTRAAAGGRQQQQSMFHNTKSPTLPGPSPRVVTELVLEISSWMECSLSISSV